MRRESLTTVRDVFEKEQEFSSELLKEHTTFYSQQYFLFGFLVQTVCKWAH